MPKEFVGVILLSRPHGLFQTLLIWDSQHRIRLHERKFCRETKLVKSLDKKCTIFRIHSKPLNLGHEQCFQSSGSCWLITTEPSSCSESDHPTTWKPNPNRNPTKRSSDTPCLRFPAQLNPQFIFTHDHQRLLTSKFFIIYRSEREPVGRRRNLEVCSPRSLNGSTLSCCIILYKRFISPEPGQKGKKERQPTKISKPRLFSKLVPRSYQKV